MMNPLKRFVVRALPLVLKHLISVQTPALSDESTQSYRGSLQNAFVKKMRPDKTRQTNMGRNEEAQSFRKPDLLNENCYQFMNISGRLKF